MQNRTFKDLIIWLLIASPLWWTCGCYSTREVTKPSEAVGDYLEVTLKDGKAYFFSSWTCDSSGTVSGLVGTVKRKDPYYGWSITPVAHAINIQADSIATIHVKTKREWATTAMYVLVVAAGVALLIAWASSLPKPTFKLNEGGPHA